MRALYSALTLLALPAVLCRILWRSRRQPEYLRHLGERFGRYRRRLEPRDSPVLWLHAVSVGEMRAAQPLVLALRQSLPNFRWLLTCMTPTGRETGQSLYGDFAEIAYLPYDLPGLGARFLRHFKPAAGLLMETEIWPNLLAAAARVGVPTILVNARLSERSAQGYARFARLTRPAFERLRLAIAQTDADAERIRNCGARVGTVSGNLKFDLTPDPDLTALGLGWRQGHFARRPVVMGASTRDGEESLILDAFARLRTAEPLLILVPRHPQRFDDVARLVESRGFTVTRRSRQFPSAATQVWLGDSMGELPAYYSAADLAIMGGSLLPYGSQNLIEACACGAPVIVGPSDFNFAQATSDALASGAARRVVPTAEAIAAAIDDWLTDRDGLGVRREAAFRFAAAHRGAAARTAAAILSALSGDSVPPSLFGEQ